MSDELRIVRRRPKRTGPMRARREIGGLTDVVNSPVYATGVGLVKYGSRNLQIRNFSIGQENVFEKVIRRMKEWFGEFF
jgi:cell division protein FtsA